MNQDLLPEAAGRGRRWWSFETTAWSIWLIFLSAMSILVVFRPHRCISHIYRNAALHWWSGQDLYESGYHGFLYFPSSAVLYTPFAWLPQEVGGMAWRWLSVGLLTWAICRLCRLLLPPEHAPRAIALTLLVVIPAAAINVVRAQSEIIMFALMVLGAVEIGYQRWTRAALWLTLAAAIKPLALALAALCLVLVPPLRGRLLLGLALMLALPVLVLKLAVGGCLLALIETASAKMRIFRAPEFLGTAPLSYQRFWLRV